MNQKIRLVIVAGETEKQYWKDILRYRELIYFMSWRDILVRYKQTAIGVAWALVRPFLTMVVFTFIFGRVAKLPSDGIPYPILVFAGMLPWQFFATALSECSTGLITNSNLITKTYFPRLIIPLSAVFVSLVDFFISFAIFACLMMWYGLLPPLSAIFLPLVVFLSLACTIGFGIRLAALTVKYRDFRYIVPFIVQFGMYVSPVGFSSTVVPREWYILYSLNPMVGIIDAYRWSLLGTTGFPVTSLGLSITIIAITLASGILYFRHTERTFADII